MQHNLVRTGVVTITLLVLLAAWDGAAQPSVEWGTYLGGTDNDQGRGIAVDSSGNVYATGFTTSSGWVSGGWDTSFDANFDGYIVKLNTDGAHLWSSYLGGPNYDEGWGIAVDSSGNVYATGRTESSGWVNGGEDTVYNGDGDGYVVKLDTDGTHLWSSYLGGTSGDSGYAIAVDASGNVYATGSTSSSSWVSGGGDTVYNGDGDGYVVKLRHGGGGACMVYVSGRSW